MDKTKRLLDNTIILAIGNFSTKFLAFFMIPFYTIWLSPEKYGEFELLYTLGILIVSFITLQIEHAIFRYVLTDRKQERNYFINGLFIVIINIIVTSVISIIFFRRTEYLCSFILFFASYAIYNCCLKYVRGKEEIKKYSAVNIITSLLIIINSIFFVYWGKWEVKGMLYAYASSYIIGSIVFLFQKKQGKVKAKIEKEVIKKMLQYSVPLLPNGISWWINTYLDRFMINMMIGDYSTGIYAIANKIPSAVTSVYNVFDMAWVETAILSNEEGEESKNQYYQQVFLEIIKLLFTANFVVLAGLKILFSFWVNERYDVAIYQVPILLIGTIFLCFSSYLNAIFLADNKTKQLGVTFTIAVIINILFNLVLIGKIGIYGASIATAISSVALFSIRYFLERKRFQSKVILKEIIKYTILYIVISFTILLNQFFTQVIILCITIFLFVYWNKNVIFLILKKFKKENTKG